MDSISATQPSVARPEVDTTLAARDSDTAIQNLTGDFETFLTLLTTQLKNQDPSQPLDSTQFVAQLASFSGVEQQIGTNEKLTELIEAVTAGSSSNLASWVGKEVRSTAEVAFDGAPINVTFDIPDTADSAALKVLDDTGLVIARIPVETSATTLDWSGERLDGSTAETGQYSFVVQLYNGEETAGTAPAHAFAEVTEARIEDGSAVLVFGDGTRLPASDVTAIRPLQNG